MVEVGARDETIYREQVEHMATPVPCSVYTGELDVGQSDLVCDWLIFYFYCSEGLVARTVHVRGQGQFQGTSLCN